MISHWSIRSKLRIGLGVMALGFCVLFGAAMYGLNAYRGLVKSLAARSTEMPLADQLSQHVGNMRVIVGTARERILARNQTESFPDIGLRGDDRYSTPHSGTALSIPPSSIDAAAAQHWLLRDLQDRYHAEFDHFRVTLQAYRQRLDENATQLDVQIGDHRRERATVVRIEKVLEEIQSQQLHHGWLLDELSSLEFAIERLRGLTHDLPNHLHERLFALSGEVRASYRAAMTITCGTALLVFALTVAAVAMFHREIERPLSALFIGSRRIAAGDFNYHIAPVSPDEIGQLAQAMNDMTTRFRDIRDDLDRQVRQRTQEVLRTEKLASVGFLAAGVAHEINNPLASIALCSESLERRIAELAPESTTVEGDWQVVRQYLEMIQAESFRCKQITEKLLDFSRMGDSRRHAADLRELATDVVEMVQHLGRYQGRSLHIEPGPPVIADVNPQELKQVLLNLVTNGLDSLDHGGWVRIEITSSSSQAQVTVSDNGCGLTDEVRQHLFEPFFTRRRSGTGTGLGLSITQRIIDEHHGRITVDSDGPGRGSRFTVMLPLRNTIAAAA